MITQWVRRMQVCVVRSCLAAIAAAVSLNVALAAEPAAPKPPSKFKPFAEVTKDAKKIEGLFDLYQKDEHLYAVITAGQMDQSFLAPMAIARGLASAGTPLNFGDEWVIQFHRAGDRVQVIRKNLHYEAPKGSPLERAVEQNYLDSIVMAVPVISENPPGGGVLVDFSDIFFTNFANLPLGGLDRSRTTWHQAKGFENNVELQVKATFQSGLRSSFSDDGVVDPRGVTVVLHYSLTKLPPPGYKPRYADQRVGYFISATKDFGSPNPDTNFRRRINRWRLEKANPESKLSPPKKQIVWWVENTVPHAYRPFVEEGILEWNKAFEKIGFRNALDVRWQNDSDAFDPEDTNYCTFRWITTPSTYAMSGLRADPITGEMIDGDVVFDASFIRYWKQEYALLVGRPYPAGTDAGSSSPVPMDAGEIVSPIMAFKRGFGLPIAPPQEQMRARMLYSHSGHAGHDHGTEVLMPQLVPSSWTPLQMMLNRRLAEGRLCTCQFSMANRHEYRLAALALAAASEDDKSEGDDKDGDKKEDKKTPAELPEEFVGQTIKHIVMHEVGHSLGLRHNFKASTMLDLDEVNDKSITREKGLTGSVMDYTPLNISADQSKQGDFATTTIGPYDYWAIEYAYKPISGNEEDELKKIAARSPQPDLAYATDEDLWSSNDPQVNAYDLGSDPLAYGKDRMALAARLMKDLDSKVVEDGQSWARLRSAFSALLSQYGNSAFLAAQYIAGQSFSRDFKSSDEKSRDPVTPISSKRQREALEFLAKEILSDTAFQFSPKLLRRLTMEHWYHWGSDSMSSSTIDYPIYDYILSIQRIPLDHCLDASVLGRMQNLQLLSDGEEEPLKMDEVFRTLTDNVWSEVSAAGEGDEERKLELSIIRRNLQREHLRKLSTIVIGSPRNPLYDFYNYVVFYGSAFNYPADARSLARMHLKDLSGKIGKVLEDKDVEMDDTTRAHLQEAQEQITKTLEAKFEAAGP